MLVSVSGGGPSAFSGDCPTQSSEKTTLLVSADPKAFLRACLLRLQQVSGRSRMHGRLRRSLAICQQGGTSTFLEDLLAEF